MAKTRTPAMHWGILCPKGIQSDSMDQSLFRARSSCVSPIFTRNCARIYSALGSNVPKYRYPHQRATTSSSTPPSDTPTARLDAEASALVGTDTRPPLWVTNDLRVTAGNIDRKYLWTASADPKGRRCYCRYGEGTGMFPRDAH